MSGYLKLSVYGEEIGKVLTDGRATMDKLIDLAGGEWLEEYGTWTIRPDMPQDSDWWYGPDDVEVEEVNE